jgi:phytoene dehydrogenase-like protein
LGSRKCFAPAARSASSTASSVAPILVPSAPGFQDCVLARHVSTPAMLEAGDANLLGGDISGGAMSVGQMLFRPSVRQYATSNPGIFLCSSSTPPGGGVHGMCGYHAALRAAKRE